jgi:hypothetical protein
MADVDLPNQFPNSKMAGAVKLGQSRFISVDVAGTLLKTPASPPPPEPDPKTVVPNG